MFKRNKPKAKFRVKSFRRRRFKILIGKTKTIVLPIMRKVTPIFILIVVIGIIVFAISLIRSNKYLKVTSIQVIADETDQSKITDFLKKYKNISILNIQSSQLANDLKNNFPEIRQVYVEKTLTGEIDVEIIKEIPAFILTNLTGSYVLNYEGKIIKILDNPGLALNDFEQKILTNSLSLDDDAVKNKYFEGAPVVSSSSSSGQDISKIWGAVPIDQKMKIVSDFTKDLDSKIQDYYKKAEDKLKTSSHTSSISFFEHKNIKYSISDTVDKNNLIFLGEILDYLKGKQLTIQRITWSSDYSIDFLLTTGPTLIFSNERPLQDQFKDMDTILFYGKLTGVKIVDVRTSKYSIIH